MGPVHEVPLDGFDLSGTGLGENVGACPEYVLHRRAERANGLRQSLIGQAKVGILIAKYQLRGGEHQFPRVDRGYTVGKYERRRRRRVQASYGFAGSLRLQSEAL